MTYSDGTNSGFSRRNHYVGQPAVKVGSSNFDYYRKPEKSHGFAKRVAFSSKQIPSTGGFKEIIKRSISKRSKLELNAN